MSERITISTVLLFRAEIIKLREKLHQDAVDASAAVLGETEFDCAQAMIRIDKGEYGRCLNCSEDIELNRLRANPLELLCLSCLAEMKVLEAV